WCAVVRVDSRSLGARPLLHPARGDGREYVLAAENDAGSRRRSRAAEDDDVHAPDDGVHLPMAPGRGLDLLRGLESVGDRAAVPDEPSDRSACRPHGTAGSREARENEAGWYEQNGGRARAVTPPSLVP